MELLTWFQASATLNCLLLFIAEFLLPKSFFRHLKFVNKMKKIEFEKVILNVDVTSAKTSYACDNQKYNKPRGIKAYKIVFCLNHIGQFLKSPGYKFSLKSSQI